MSDVFAVGFLMFLAGTIAGIIWRTVADFNYYRVVEGALREQEARHDREMKRMAAALAAARAKEARK